MTRRDREIRYGAAVALVLIGVICGIVLPGTLGGTLASVFVGLGLIGVVSLIFYEVGLTEDRDRARQETAASERQRPSTSPRPRPRPLQRRPLDRMRGKRRRLP